MSVTEERYDRQFNRLNDITHELVKFVNDKDKHYGSSWRKRGGTGAFFTIVRKWDRIETACERSEPAQYDLFEVFGSDSRSETILDDCLDLVGYLLVLVEHMIEIGHVTKIKELKMRFDAPGSQGKSKGKSTVGISRLDDAVVDDELRSGMKHPFRFEAEEDI